MPSTFGLFGQAAAGFYVHPPVVTYPDQYPYKVNGVERMGPNWSGNDNQVALDYAKWFCPTFGSRPAESGTGHPRRQSDHHGDFHFRFWVKPVLLNVSNPTLGADIPFRIWNTFPTPETLTAINVVGSSVLTFDLTVGNVLLDFQYLDTNLQIGAGEPTVDAEVNFVFTHGIGILLVKALVASTFSIIPEVPVNETWEFATDTLTSWNGKQSRLSLAEHPRVSLDMKITLVDYGDRRALYDLIISAIRAPSLVPMFQYATPLTAMVALGTTRLYFDPTLTNVRVGVYVAVMNRTTQESVLGNVSAIYADGCEIDTAVGQALSPPLWFVMPALTCFIEDQSGLEFGTQAGSFSLNAQALQEFTLIRPSSTQVVNTFDGLPVLEKQMLITTKESFSYRRDLMDGGVGARVIRSRDLDVVVSRTFKFSVDRNSDELDYFRTFYSTVRGSQKPFLKSTQLPDIGLGAAVVQGTSTLTLDRPDYVAKLFPYEPFKRIEVLYANGARSYHVVTSAAIDAFNVATITISPSLVDDPNYVALSRISYLQKVTASDTVRLEHYNDYTYVKFNARTVEA